MIEYIYFVKCPNCEDEHFSFFNEAKEFALSYLSQKPIITQVEVNRNDFGECTDSCDLGTVWSWEDMMQDTATDAEPAVSVFTKEDLKTLDHDPEFDTLDNSVDFDPVVEHVNDRPTPVESTQELHGIDNAIVDCEVAKVITHSEDEKPIACKRKPITEDSDRKLKTWICFYDGDDVGTVEAYDKDEAMDEFERQYADECFFDSWDHDWHVEEAGEDYVAVDESCKRKPIPEGMTIEQLVEEMEENEDTVECVACQELYPKEECKYDEKHGWICPDCQDEVVECTWCEELYDRSQCRYEVDMGWLCDRCEAAIKSRGETLTFREGNYWDFLDEAKDTSVAATKANESFSSNETVSFEYEDLEVTLQGAKRDVDDWDEEEVKVDYTYRVDAGDVATELWDNFLTEEDVADVPGGFETLENDNAAWEKFLETHFDALVEKYYTQLLDHYREDAAADYEAEHALEDYYDDAEWDHADSMVDDILASRFNESSNTKSMLEELEDSDAYSDRLAPCPECGEENAFDHETGICIRCGFSI